MKNVFMNRWSVVLSAVALFAVIWTSSAHADQVTLKAQISATALHPELSGIKMACWMLYTDDFNPQTMKKWGPYPFESKSMLSRKADGTASGQLSVVVDNWVPEIKYYYCFLESVKDGGTSGFYLPTDPYYDTQPNYRRAKSGTLKITGTIQ